MQATGNEALDHDATGKPTPPEVRQALEARLVELRQKHMHEWLDRPVPALSNRTPRQAATTAEGRRELRLLLKEFEFGEAGQPESRRFLLTFFTPSWDCRRPAARQPP